MIVSQKIISFILSFFSYWLKLTGVNNAVKLISLCDEQGERSRQLISEFWLRYEQVILAISNGWFYSE